MRWIEPLLEDADDGLGDEEEDEVEKEKDWACQMGDLSTSNEGPILMSAAVNFREES